MQQRRRLRRQRRLLLAAVRRVASAGSAGQVGRTVALWELHWGQRRFSCREVLLRTQKQQQLASSGRHHSWGELLLRGTHTSSRTRAGSRGRGAQGFGRVLNPRVLQPVGPGVTCRTAAWNTNLAAAASVLWLEGWAVGSASSSSSNRARGMRRLQDAVQPSLLQLLLQQQQRGLRQPA
jgi:hypothetical protein